jgi:hypothetical protein
VQKLALILGLTLDVINGVLNLHQSQIKANVKTGHLPLISILQSGPQASCIIEIWSGRSPSHGHHRRLPARALNAFHDLFILFDV